MSHWQHFQDNFLRDTTTGLSLDVSRMGFDPDFFDRMAPLCTKALAEMAALEAGAIANPDEGRMVGHYWLRAAALAPTPALQAEIERDIAASESFAAAVHAGTIAAPSGRPFSRLLIIGIGGSALGPQLTTAALIDEWQAPVRTHFFDNTDPEGFQRILAEIGPDLATTLTVVISKSGGTPETRNGMLAAEAAYAAAGLDMARQAVAVTGTAAGGISSKLEAYAIEHGWLKIFPMTDWVGGRTSVMSTVGLVPLALQGADIRAFLAGAAAVDERTRSTPARQNMSLLLALAWHHAGGGQGAKDMVILPYKDRLALMSKYLQQLVMESLGKQHDRHGATVNQGIAVYGNKGSTDQHAYVQQLRDGPDDHFVTFVAVLDDGWYGACDVDPGIDAGDTLQGLYLGTRRALAESGHPTLTLTLHTLDARTLGACIALYERAVGLFAELVNVNAYDQPGVEAGKKAAGAVLALKPRLLAALVEGPGTVGELLARIGVTEAAAVTAAHSLLWRLSINERGVRVMAGATGAEDRFAVA